MGMTSVSLGCIATYAICWPPDPDKSATSLVYPRLPMRYGVFTFEIDMVRIGGSLGPHGPATLIPEPRLSIGLPNGSCCDGAVR